MKALYLDGQLRYTEDFAKPVREPDEALIKVRLAAVCNTDKEIIKGYKGFQGILGHEFVGVVEDVEAEDLIGKRVVGEINIGCQECDLCRRGYPNHCINRRVLGIVGKNGAFAEYITLPVRNLHIVPDDIADEEAVFAEPLAAALEIMQQCHIKPTVKVAVVGDGKLGQLITQVLSLTGCDLTLIGRNPSKLALAQGRAKTVAAGDVSARGEFDVVVDCTGNEEGLKTAQYLIKPMGTIILKSTYNNTALMNPTEWVVKEFTILGSRCGPMDAALRLLERKLVSVRPLLSAVYALRDYEEAFSSKQNFKVIFDLHR